MKIEVISHGGLLPHGGQSAVNFVLKIKWGLRISDAETSSNF